MMKKAVLSAVLAPLVSAGVFAQGFDDETRPATTPAGKAKPIEVRVRQTPGGPRIFVDGKAVRPRFFYGSVPVLGVISWKHPSNFVVPFRPDEDVTDATVAIDTLDPKDTMWFSNAKLTDKTDGTTVAVPGPEGEEKTVRFRRGGLKLKKGHLYWFTFTHRAARYRTYFSHRVTYRAADGTERELPLPYGDTLNETAALAAEAEVNFVTFSTHSSWGCEDWWAPPAGRQECRPNGCEQYGYGKIDEFCAKLVKANPKVLLVPRVSVNAPAWMLKAHPEMKMRFGGGYTIEMNSVSSRPWRKAACAEAEKLARHLREKFPRNFAGLHLSGQNSAEWFYMMSQSGELSGYDVATRDAFREWLAAEGEPGAAKAAVPTVAERRKVRPGYRYDAHVNRRLLQFHRFRQREMTSLLNDLGAAIRRGTDGQSLALFFYGYTWEVGGVKAGAGETGHFDMEWLLRNAKDNIDGFSSPISYTNRAWPGTAPLMSAADSVMRAGFLWINENDNRTHHEDIWDHMWWPKHDDPWRTRQDFLRDSATQILRGYGDWWMDLLGRGWFRDREVWKVRRDLNVLDEVMLERKRPYSPDIAVVVNEESFLANAWDSDKRMGPLLDRRGYDLCGATYGQYFLNDVLENPLDGAKLYVMLFQEDLSGDRQTRYEDYKRSHPKAVFLENVTPEDLRAEALAAAAKKAGAQCYVEPNKAHVQAAEGYVMISSHVDGHLPIDFGTAGPVRDFLTGETVGQGPVVTLPFRFGETRIFRADGTDAPK